MPGVLTTDHPAWIETTAGVLVRAVRTASGVWVLSWDQEGPHVRCVQGSEDVKPAFVTTDPSRLPGSVPAELKAGLDDLGPTRRLTNPWLWDAITTAILRQVVRAGQARKLYRAWCGAFGTTVESTTGDLSIAPTAARVLALDDEQFADVGAKFHRSVLRAAATHYERHHAHWGRMDSRDLVAALTASPGRIAERIAARGPRNRFHLDPTAPAREVDLYDGTARTLMTANVKVLIVNTDDTTPTEVAASIADTIPPSSVTSAAPPPPSTPQEP